MTTQIYVNQTQVKLILQTDVDFNSYTVSSSKIKYQKPDGTKGEWDSAIVSGSEELGQIYVNFTDTPPVIKFDKAGVWKLWAYIIFSNAKIGIGVPIEYFVKTEGAKR